MNSLSLRFAAAVRSAPETRIMGNRTTVAQLAERVDGIEAGIQTILAAINGGETAPVTNTAPVVNTAGSLKALRASVGDEFGAFDDVYKARLRKALPYAKDNGPVCLYYVWSANKRRSYVQPAKQATKFSRNGTLLCTVMPNGTVQPAVEGLPTLEAAA